jgi:hypothetical protein
MTVTRSTYIKRVKRGSRDWRKKYTEAWVAAQREVFKAYAKQWADGYNAIVSNWSSKSKPRFVGVAEFQKRTGRWFVRVQIVGDETQRKRFEGLDFGAARGQKVQTADVSDPKVLARQLKNKGLTSRINLPRGVPRRQKVGEENKAYDAYVRQVKAQYTTLYRGSRPATAAEISRASRREMLPMHKYLSKTGRGGRIGDTGKTLPTPTGWAHEYKLGPIDARSWTFGLYALVETGQNLGGAKKIWPRVSTWSNTVARAYDRGSRRARESSG